MKLKYIKTALVGIILLQVTACTDILDKDPVSSFSASGFYKTTADAQAGIYGIDDAAQSVFRMNFCYWGEGRADNVQTAQSGESLVLSSNNLTNTASSANWTALYTMISRANYAIAFIPGIYEDDNVQGKELLGQAHALRALAYFYLVRVWGDVPFITDPYTSGDQDIFISKTDRETVLDQVEADLQYAAANCIDRYNSNNDRIMFTRGGANGLLTQVYMWRHKYTEALATSSLVMSNSLYGLVPIADWGKMFSRGATEGEHLRIGYNDTETKTTSGHCMQ